MAWTPANPGTDTHEQLETEERIVAVVRDLARELGGDRAANAVTATASLERDVGLGSLERVELLTRLESELGRELADRFLFLDSAREIARAVREAPILRVTPPAAAERQPVAAPLRLERMTTLVDALKRRAEAEPTRVHAFLHTNGSVQRVTYAELWDGAARIARGLRDRGIQKGEPVAIMLPTSFDYLQSFMGVLAAGAIAVPLYPPARLDRLADYLVRQAGILANARARLMISFEEAAPVSRLLRHAAPALQTIATTAALRADEPAGDAPCDATDAALIQYTSGSTGAPKGVLLTHANLLANIRAIAIGVQLAPSDAVVSWLPLYHDMGLIGTWLNAMVHGIPLTLMSPLSFLARPERWLWAIHEQQATLSPAPNFAYELCVRKIRDQSLAGLDLSSWRVASNGAEPVSPATIDRFARRFAPFGFKPEAMFPVYGLAECSVALCFPPLGRAPRIDTIDRATFEREGRAVAPSDGRGQPLSFVSVGKPLPEHEVRLVDDKGADVADRVVGRLLFRGPSCMSGYYENPEATALVMSPDGWIDSGDRAYRADDELFITGRVKDLIIKSGRNLVPQEIEEVVGEIDGIRRGRVAAFGVPDEASGTERLIVLAESRSSDRSERMRLEQEAVRAVVASVGIPPDTVRIVPPGTIPKTPSGKIRRSETRQSFEAGRVRGDRRTAYMAFARLTLERAGATLAAGTRAVLRGVQLIGLIIAWTMAIVVLGPIIAVLLVVLPAGRPVRLLSRALSRIMLAVNGTPLTVEGAEHVPREGPVVFVSNHTSFADTPVLLAALPGDFVFVAMAEIISWRVIGSLARRGGHLAVDRWHTQQSVADAAAVEQRLRAGERVLFFAEGGFSRARGLRPFRLGAFEAAVAAGVPVVPVALRGTRELLPAGARMPRPRRVHVWIGEAIHPAGHDWNAVVGLRDRTADAIAMHGGEPRLQAPAAKAHPGPSTDSESAAGHS